jgi:hypothetical protein
MGISVSEDSMKKISASRAAGRALLIAGTLLVAAAANAAEAPWAGTRKADILDPQYQMAAYSIDVPSGWKFAGTIARDPGCHSSGPGLKYTTQSPDGLTAVIALPGMTWSWTTSASIKKTMESSFCPPIDIDSAASFLINIAVPNLHPNTKIVSVLNILPEGQAALAAQLQQARQQNAEMARRYGQPPQKLTADAARVRVQYNRDGHPVEEQILSVVDCFESQFPAMFAQPAYSRRTCQSRSTVIARAPAGHLDDLLNSAQLKAFNQSLQVNQAWNSRVSADAQAAFQRAQRSSDQQFQAMMQKSRQDHEQLMANGRAFQQQQRASTDNALAADRAKQNAIDASAHATALYSLDRQEFKNPATGQTIEASSQYNHQWLSSDGTTLIQTNDHGFDPNGQVYPVSQSWAALVPK